VNYTVYLVGDAEQDLLEIYRYVARHDSPAKADRLLGNLERSILKLESMPSSGHVPPELERVGVTEFREVFFKPYRIIYQVLKSDVYVHGVLDGRRALQDLLEERLLRR
jgi:toxin ParE1/3/4